MARLSTAPLCARPDCAVPRRHHDGCPNHDNHLDNGCRGCLPAQAADGLILCPLHVDQGPEDALTLARLHTDLELQLRRSGKGEYTSGSRDRSNLPDQTVIDARHHIGFLLTGMVELMMLERGFTAPALRASRPVRDSRSEDALLRLADEGVGGLGEVGTAKQTASEVEIMAAYIAKHWLWFAARDDAAKHSKALHDAARGKVALASSSEQGVRISALAYPSRSKDFQEIGSCPLVVTVWAEDESLSEETCGGRVVWYPEQSALAYCDGCDHAETLEWWRLQIMGVPNAVIDSVAGAAWLSDKWRRPVRSSQIANWASRSRLARLTEKAGDKDVPVKDKRGRQLYRLDELEACATKMFGPPAQVQARGKLVSA